MQRRRSLCAPGVHWEGTPSKPALRLVRNAKTVSHQTLPRVHALHARPGCIRAQAFRPAAVVVLARSQRSGTPPRAPSVMLGSSTCTCNPQCVASVTPDSLRPELGAPTAHCARPGSKVLSVRQSAKCAQMELLPRKRGQRSVPPAKLARFSTRQKTVPARTAHVACSRFGPAGCSARTAKLADLRRTTEHRCAASAPLGITTTKKVNLHAQPATLGSSIHPQASRFARCAPQGPSRKQTG